MQIELTLIIVENLGRTWRQPVSGERVSNSPDTLSLQLGGGPTSRAASLGRRCREAERHRQGLRRLGVRF